MSEFRISRSSVSALVDELPDELEGGLGSSGSSRGVDFLSRDEKVETIFARLLELDDAEGLTGPELIRSEFSGPPTLGSR